MSYWAVTWKGNAWGDPADWQWELWVSYGHWGMFNLIDGGEQ